MKRTFAVFVALCTAMPGMAISDVTPEQLAAISTPNEVETSIGTLRFFDGAVIRGIFQRENERLGLHGEA